jgi:plasmid maintenance system antidote protein VapI
METVALMKAWILWKTRKDGKAFTQREWAELSGVSKSNISKLCLHGGKIRTITACRLAAVLGVSPEMFYAGPEVQSHMSYEEFIQLGAGKEVPGNPAMLPLSMTIKDLAQICCTHGIDVHIKLIPLKEAKV